MNDTKQKIIVTIETIALDSDEIKEQKFIAETTNETIDIESITKYKVYMSICLLDIDMIKSVTPDVVSNLQNEENEELSNVTCVIRYVGEDILVLNYDRLKLIELWERAILSMKN